MDDGSHTFFTRISNFNTQRFLGRILEKFDRCKPKFTEVHSDTDFIDS